MMRGLARLGVGLAALLAAGGCAYDYGYGGVNVGAGYGGYYDYGYDDFGYAPFGWYGGYYYPGNGYWLYDRRGVRRNWNDRERAYWEHRRAQADGRWRGPSTRPWQRGDRGWASRPDATPGQVARPDRDWRRRTDRSPGDGVQARPDGTTRPDWRNRAERGRGGVAPRQDGQARPDWRNGGGVERRAWRQRPDAGAGDPPGWRGRGGPGAATPRPQAAPPVVRAPRAEGRQRAVRGSERLD